MCNDELVGIVSFGVECGHPQFPVVYTDVSMQREFIVEAIKYSGASKIVFSLCTVFIAWLISLA